MDPLQVNDHVLVVVCACNRTTCTDTSTGAGPLQVTPVVGLVVSSTRNGFVNQLVCVYCGHIELVIVEILSEHLHQADLSTQALRVDMVRVLVVLTGSFMSHIKTQPTLT